ncbi:hypothetical protein C1H46_005869 [Malus baccata]|uniref:Uncharacterized protein n=1 Tax=Malus baccata TaxID=106549 RepID=A0A540ND87_MALBA|nr:hypothetical protein C1H46_005869 [Malus baccata]
MERYKHGKLEKKLDHEANFGEARRRLGLQRRRIRRIRWVWFRRDTLGHDSPCHQLCNTRKLCRLRFAFGIRRLKEVMSVKGSQQKRGGGGGGEYRIETERMEKSLKREDADTKNLPASVKTPESSGRWWG